MWMLLVICDSAAPASGISAGRRRTPGRARRAWSRIVDPPASLPALLDRINRSVKESQIARNVPTSLCDDQATLKGRTFVPQKYSHPIEFGKPLRYSLKGARLRVGDWRLIYKIEPPDVVLVVKIGHRREVYEG
jgi:mRNA-degrading endonuclease RelE of RelBE toxin-antitoxin system